MKTIKWAEIANPVSRERYQLLGEYLEKLGVPNQATFIECPPDDFKETLKKAKLEYDHILIGSPFCEVGFDPKNELTATVQFVKAVDCWSKDEAGNWWPQSLLFEAFIHSLAHRIKALDLSSAVLMVGAGGAARAVLSALARVGFLKFNITDRYQEKVQTLISDLKRTYFNLKFDYVPQSGITALPGMHSLVVNTTPLVEGNDLVRELQFYNFLKEGGAVIDLTLVPPKTPLLEEAEHIGSKILTGPEVAAEVDAIWTEWISGKKLDIGDYTAALTERLSQVKIDLEAFRHQ